MPRGITSITTHRFNMRASVLKQNDVTADPINPTNYGQWVNSQDPLTGEIVRKWVPYPDDTTTPDDEFVEFKDIKCMVRGIVDGGIRVAGNTERFGAEYDNMEYIKLWTPARVRLTKRDRITNIRSHKNGQIIFLDEEYEGAPKATVFNIQGVTPLFDAFNKHVENFILLERAELDL